MFAITFTFTLRFTCSLAQNAARRSEPVTKTQTETQLLQINTFGSTSGSLERQEQTAIAQYSPSWFGMFAEDESTFDDNGQAQVSKGHIDVLDGWDPLAQDDVDAAGAFAARTFHESPSAGSDDSWATHFPQSHSGVASAGGSVPAWRITKAGTWVQDFVPAVVSEVSGGNDATWFDVSTAQFDGFGRQRQPNPGTDRWFDMWTQRRVNTTLMCQDPGCTATASLDVFDPQIELARNCKLNVPVHPTDFDDQFSGERVEFIDVNGVRVNTDCFPLQSSCAEVENPMFHCVSQLPLDVLMNSSTGKVDLAAKISLLVDECAHDGNLLSAIPEVTCMVMPLPTPLPEPTPASPVMERCTAGILTVSGSLNCPERGCVAHVELPLNAQHLFLDHCTLAVQINQTDFDGDLGSLELVEWVNVSGDTVVSDVVPGQNPCGCSNSSSNMSFALLQDHNVTNVSVNEGIVQVSAKISDAVDECASNGYLLDGKATVTCSVSCAPSSDVSGLASEP